jgi:hypothetical protein
MDDATGTELDHQFIQTWLSAALETADGLMLTYKEEICSKEGVESEEVQHPER